MSSGPPKSAGPAPSVSVPNLPANFERRVYAAYLIALGAKLESVAEDERVNIHIRTLYDWRQHWSWPEAMAEARQRWLDDCESAANLAILKALRNGDAATARWYKDRTDAQFRPRSSVDVTRKRRGLSKAKAQRLRQRVFGVGGDE